MERKALQGQLAASAAPLSRALLVGRTLYVSGTLGVGSDGRLAEGIEAQTRQALENIRGLVEEAGGRMEDVVSTRVYLARREDFAAMNDAYAAAFSPPYPARTTVAVTHINPDCLVEIEVVAQLRAP
jgi:2-iminobutanoate/2-iminopropanoate deaminase